MKPTRPQGTIRATGFLLLFVWAIPSLCGAQESILGQAPAWKGPTDNTRGVALGDVDGDGDLDLVHGARLYRNTGRTFESVSSWPGPREDTQSVALGDVDGDGDLDLVRGNLNKAATLYRNTGGSFESEPAWTGPVENTRSVALGDVDADGDLDLVRGNENEGATLYRNTGGTFELTPAWTGRAEATWSVVLGDVDGDGDLDLVCGNKNEGATLYRNTGGTFELTPSWTGPAEATRSVALGDVDGDGDLDLLRGNENEGITLYRNTGGTFEPTPAWTGPVENTRCMALGDMDGDGDLDLVRGSCCRTIENEQDGNATLYRNIGGTFESSPAWTGPDRDTWSVALGDADGDGDLDLVGGNSGGATLYRNTGGAFQSDPAWTGPVETTKCVALGDVDGDGDLDLVRGNYSGGVTLYRYTGETFEADPAWKGPREWTESVALGDVDGDGDLDLVCGNFKKAATLYRNTGGSFEPEPAWTGPVEATRSVALGDVDGDGDLDLVRGNTEQANTLYRNTGGIFEAEPVWTGPNVFLNYAVALGDVDGDGDLDLVSGNYFSAATLHRNIGGTFEADPAWTGPVESTTCIVLGDVDGDGDLDLVRANYYQGVTLYRNTGRTFEADPAWTGPQESTWSVALGDVDGDGDLDLVSGNDDLGATLYRNMGGTFELTPAWKGPAEKTHSVTLGDVDGDGDLDLVRGNYNQGVTLYRRQSHWLAAGVPYLSRVDDTATDETWHRISFAAVDRNANPLWIVGHYQFAGSPVWYPMQFENGSNRVGPWSTTLEGVRHQVLWSTEAVPPDQRNVVIRLRAVTTMGGAGTARFIPSYHVDAGPLNVSVSSLAQGDSRGEFPAGEEARVAVSVPGWARFREGRLFFRAGGAAAYDSTDLVLTEILPDVLAPIGTVPPEAMGSRGLEYWVRVRTATKSVTDPPIDPSASPHSLRTKFARVEETHDHAARRFRMVSVPADLELESTASLVAILSDQPDFGLPDPVEWRAFRYVPSDSAYLEVTADSDDGRLSPRPGRAFWLISRRPHSVDTAPIPARSVPTDSAFRVVLEPGWNQLANPFNFPVSWSEVTWEGSPEAVEPPVGWDEANQSYKVGDVATLEPFDGCWVRNTTDQPVTLLVPPREATTQAARRTLGPSSKVLPNGWSIQIIASSGVAVDERNVAGVARLARQGIDSYDRSDPPPAPGEAVSLYFLGVDDSKGEVARRTVDIRPLLEGLTESSKGSQWVFDVALTGIQEPREVTLTFKDMAGVPSDLQVRLVDREVGQTIDLRGRNSYKCVARPNVRAARVPDARFELLVGTPAYMDASHSPTSAPQVTRLLPNFPNPFATGTIIRFELSKPGPVTVSVFDVSGRLVRTVTDRTLEGGIHEVLWDGGDDQGATSAAGIYFVRMVTSAGAETRKVVRLRVR